MKTAIWRFGLAATCAWAAGLWFQGGMQAIREAKASENWDKATVDPHGTVASQTELAAEVDAPAAAKGGIGFGSNAGTIQ